jgi:hypothetical protein
MTADDSVEWQCRPGLAAPASAPPPWSSETGFRLAQKIRFGPCIPVGIQRVRDDVGPTSGLSHLRVELLHRGGHRGVLEVGAEDEVICAPPCIFHS